MADDIEVLILGIAVGIVGSWFIYLLLSIIRKIRAERTLNQYMEEFKWK